MIVLQATTSWAFAFRATVQCVRNLDFGYFHVQFCKYNFPSDVSTQTPHIGPVQFIWDIVVVTNDCMSTILHDAQPDVCVFHTFGSSINFQLCDFVS